MSARYEREQKDREAAKAERRERGRRQTLDHLQAQLNHESAVRQAETDAFERSINDRWEQTQTEKSWTPPEDPREQARTQAEKTADADSRFTDVPEKKPALRERRERLEETKKSQDAAYPKDVQQLTKKGLPRKKPGPKPRTPDVDPNRFSALEEKPKPRPDPEPSQRGNPRVRDAEILARAVSRLSDDEKGQVATLLRGIDGTGLTKDQREALTQDVITGYLLSRTRERRPRRA